jgi:hypothetical protein
MKYFKLVNSDLCWRMSIFVIRNEKNPVTVCEITDILVSVTKESPELLQMLLHMLCFGNHKGSYGQH